MSLVNPPDSITDLPLLSLTLSAHCLAALLPVLRDAHLLLPGVALHLSLGDALLVLDDLTLLPVHCPAPLPALGLRHAVMGDSCQGLLYLTIFV